MRGKGFQSYWMMAKGSVRSNRKAYEAGNEGECVVRTCANEELREGVLAGVDAGERPLPYNAYTTQIEK